jgi:hypothetical protein
MRIGDDIRKSVVFFGYVDHSPGNGGIECVGTGFLMAYKNVGYLVTAKHLAHQLGSDPFLLRLNRHDGTAENIPVDGFEWSEHPDPTVDVSIIPMHIDQSSQYDCVYLDGDASLLLPELMRHDNIGVGNFTYTLGLFRLMRGEKRNLPICHFGTIAMLPGDERVPVRDWTDPTGKRRIFVETYLVESQSLGGLSGSPVYVRPEYNIDLSGLLQPQFPARDNEKPLIAAGRKHLRLLGLWQGAWEAPADEIRAAQSGKDIKVPVGMGLVVPCQRIIEVLELPGSVALREEILAEHQLRVSVPRSSRAGTSDEDPAR